MNSLVLAIQEIIKVQQSIIGPIAIDQARKVAGLKIVTENDVELTGPPKEVLNDLVKKYADFFGQASIEVCRDAVCEIKPPIERNELPDILK